VRDLPSTIAGLIAPGQPFAMRDVPIGDTTIRAWAGGFRTLRDVLVNSATFGDTTFLVSGAERVTFAEHAHAVAALAQHLSTGLGIKPGDRVAIAMRNRPEWSIAFWATVSIGAVAVPLNAWWTADELAFALDDSGARVAVVDSERAVRLGERVLAGLESVLVAGAPAPAGLPTFESVLAPRYRNSVLPPVDLDEDATATLFYTSGTTGRPKGVVGSHRNMVSNLLSRRFFRELDAARGGRIAPTALPRTLLTVPLFHVTGAHSYLLTALAQGSLLVFMPKWDVAEALMLIERERLTSLGGVPFMALQLLDEYRPDQHDLTSLTAIAVGGAAPPPDLPARLAAALPAVVAGNGYGMTETSSVAIYNYGDEYREHPAATGRVTPILDARLVAPDGGTVSSGPGELWLRGANVVSGYWNRPAETESAFRPGGWLCTGDLATIDDGLVTIVGRSKEVIIRGGENIAPAEVAAALMSHPAVRDAAVAGIPDNLLGESVGAVVRVESLEQVSESALRTHVAATLAAFKVPVRIVVTTEPLARNPQGKLLPGPVRALLLDPN
jgi:long-chain acyl-CoA synthetase